MVLRATTIRRSLLVAAIFTGCVHPESNTTPQKDVPETPEEMFHVGEIYANRGNYLRAEQYMAAGLQGGYADPQAIHKLLEVCLEGSFLRSGIEHANWYLGRKPADMDVRLSLAALYYGVGNTALAEKELDLVLSDDQVRPNAHYLAGTIAFERGPSGRDEAREQWSKYLELVPEGPRAIEVQLKLREIREEPKRLDISSVQPATDAGILDAGDHDHDTSIPTRL